MKKNGFTLLICCCILTQFLTGCNSTKDVVPTNQPSVDSSYSVIVTAMQQDDTKIVTFSKDLKEISTKSYNYGNVGGTSYYTPCVVNGVMYDISLGAGYDKDHCAIVGLDLNSQEMTTYDFKNRVNITDFAVTDDYIYAISNLNQVTYVDRYSLKEKKMDSYEINGYIAMDLCLCQENLYILVDDTKTYIMYQVDITNKTMKKVCDLTEYCFGDYEPSYYASYGTDLYLPSNDRLLKLSTTNNTLEVIPLSMDNAFGLYLTDNMLYISCMDDMFTPEAKADIIAFDLTSKKEVKNYHLKHNIMQFIVTKSQFIVLGLDDTIYQYNLSDSGNSPMIHKASIQVPDHYYTSALYKQADER